MIRLAIVVEGRTEEEFVKQLLAEHLVEHGVLASARLIGAGKRDCRGGNVSVERVVASMMRVSHTHDAVTSLIDFYGFQGRPTDDVGELERQIEDMCRERSHHTLRERSYIRLRTTA